MTEAEIIERYEALLIQLAAHLTMVRDGMILPDAAARERSELLDKIGEALSDA